VRDFSNGQDAWDYLDGLDKDGKSDDQVRIIVSDIEMPKMDGHRLLKLVRNDAHLKDVPLILFSSLISDEMRAKGDQLGASGQISKPEINQLIGLIDKLIFGEAAENQDKQ
jgi:two-component system chemotaxis response regulator CheV